MALTQQHRSVVYNAWVPDLGEEVAEALISHFPARDLDEPVTKEFVEVKTAELRLEMATEFASVRNEMAMGFASVRDEMAEYHIKAGENLARMRSEIDGRLQQTLMWMVGTMLTSTGMSLAITLALT